MKDSLKSFVDKNRPAFDDQEPPDTLWTRVSVALPRMQGQSLWGSVVVWRIAAAFFLSLSIYFYAAHRPLQDHRNETAVGLRDFSVLESFYRDQIAEKARLINDYDASGESEQFTQDFQRLDAMYEVLSEEMKSRPGEKVKDAMILNFLVRVDLLNQQLKKLEDNRKKKTMKRAEV